GASETDGFSAGAAGLAATCFGSGCFGAAGAAAVARAIGAGAGLLSAFGLAAAGGALAVVSEPPRPTLRARLEKKPSDSCAGCCAGVAAATRVAGAEAGAATTRCSSSAVSFGFGGLTCEGIVPGARDSASSE